MAEIKEWAPNTAFEKDDIVVYSGVQYKCAFSHTSSEGPDIHADRAFWHTVTE